MSTPFVPMRLRQARAVRGLTMLELGDQTGISRQTLSNYENGRHQPTSDNINRLSRVLRLPVRYFRQAGTDHFVNRPPLFRTRKSVGQRDREKVETLLLWVAEVADSTLRYLEFPTMEIPQQLLDSLPANPRQLTNYQIVEAARRLRESWELGRAPIQNLVNLLESKGIVVSVIPLELEKVDGLSMWSDVTLRPYILLNEDPGSLVRLRLTLAHELGHLVLHSGLRQGAAHESLTKLLDDQAYLFGSEFLMPEDAFVADVQSVSLEALLALKRKWKVAVSAIIYRLGQLELIDETVTSRLYRQLSIRRWRTSEPYDDEWVLERPILLYQAFETLAEEHLFGETDLEDFAGIDRQTLSRIANLPSDFLTPKPPGNILTLQFNA